MKTAYLLRQYVQMFKLQHVLMVVKHNIHLGERVCTAQWNPGLVPSTISKIQNKK